MEILCNIKVLLAARKMKARDLAAALGVTENTVSNWTNNTSYPTLTMLYKIAAVLDCGIEELYTAK